MIQKLFSTSLLCFITLIALAQNTITVSEINYNSEATVDPGNWIELYNYGTADVNIGGMIVKDNNNANVYVIPANTILAPQGRWVIAEDLVLFPALHPNVTNFSGPLGFGLGNKTDMVRLFDTQNQLLLSVTYYDSIPWPQGPDGEGRTLELLDPAGNLNDPANWFDGCIGGSPGAPYTPCNDAIIISEINYNSDSTFDTDDWVEIRNVSDNPVDIGGWKFMDDTAGLAHTYTIASPRIIPPHSNWVLAQTLTKFAPLNPSVSNMEGPFNFNLNGNGEWIRMYNTANKLTVSVHYDDEISWPAGADGGKYTLEIVDSLGKMNSGSNWQSICQGGSPGRYPSQPCPPLTSIYMPELTGMSLAVNPNPSSGYATLNLNLTKPETLSVSVLDIQGKLIQPLANGDLSEGVTELSLEKVDIPSGIYFIECKGKEGRKVIKWVKY